MEITTENLALYWAIFGIALMLAEAILPGLITIFLGMAALLVGLAIWLGFVKTWTGILTMWFVVSLILLFTVRNFFAKMAPGDTETSNTDEDLDAIGLIVEIHREVDSNSESGRIIFRGTTWPAKSKIGRFHPGQKVRLVDRRGGVWIVEKA